MTSLLVGNKGSVARKGKKNVTWVDRIWGVGSLFIFYPNAPFRAGRGSEKNPANGRSIWLKEPLS